MNTALNDTFDHTQRMAQHVHLTSGQHPCLDPTLMSIWVGQLGQPTLHSQQHAVWQVRANTGLCDMAFQAQHDVAHLPHSISWKDFSVLAMDMDSTLINIECIDEIADYCGKKAEVAAITEAAMRGEITNYDESLIRRVRLLEGLSTSALESVLNERLKLNPGAEQLVSAAHAQGLETLLVSGGFTFFTLAMQRRLGLTHQRSNVLNIENDRLLGTVAHPIVNATVKKQTVHAVCTQLNVSPQRAIAMGDGSNDLEMMSIAGLSIAYHAKPAVQAKAMAAIRFGGLDTLVHWLS